MRAVVASIAAIGGAPGSAVAAPTTAAVSTMRGSISVRTPSTSSVCASQPPRCGVCNPVIAALVASGCAMGRADSRPITAAEHDECFDCFDTEDFKSGYAAFLAKRKPEFVGR